MNWWRVCCRGFDTTIRAVSLSGLTAVVGMTILYVLPVNPLSVAHESLLDETIGAYLSQDWQLFAPNPLSTNYSLLVCPDESGTSAPSDCKEWYDITEPLWRCSHRYFFSAFGRLARVQGGPLLEYIAGDSTLEPYAQACRETHLPSDCATYHRLLDKSRAEALTMLCRIASSFCNGVAERSRSFALRILVVKAVPWSERFSGVGKKQLIELGRFSVDRSVTPASFYGIAAPARQ